MLSQSPSMLRAAIVALLLIPCVAFAAAANKKAKQGVYLDAFGAAPAPSFDEGSSASDPSKETDDAMTALGELGSFPVSVNNGDVSKSVWPGDPESTFVPSPTSRKFKIKNCGFEIKTGAFSARQYKSDDKAKFLVVQDALGTQSKQLAKFDAPAYISVTAEISAHVVAGFKDGCKDLLKTHRKKIGRIGLGDTTLTLAASNQKRFQANPVRPAATGAVFLVWDDAAQTVRIQDQAGFSPSVESAIFQLIAEAEGDLYLDLAPKLTVSHDGASAVAGN